MPENLPASQLTGTSVDRSDRLSRERTLYDASYAEIFWKNFLAGLGRSVGGMIVYALFLSVLGGVLVRFLMPILAPILASLQSMIEILDRMPRF